MYLKSDDAPHIYEEHDVQAENWMAGERLHAPELEDNKNAVLGKVDEEPVVDETVYGKFVADGVASAVAEMVYREVAVAETATTSKSRKASQTGP